MKIWEGVDLMLLSDVVRQACIHMAVRWMLDRGITTELWGPSSRQLHAGRRCSWLVARCIRKLRSNGSARNHYRPAARMHGAPPSWRAADASHGASEIVRRGPEEQYLSNEISDQWFEHGWSAQTVSNLKTKQRI